MMTREEAIQWLEENIQDTDTYWKSCSEELQRELDEQKQVFLLALTALRPVSRERVEKVWKGEWKRYLPPLGAGDVQCRCTRCGMTPDAETPFCAWCGAAMTSEAVDMDIKRLDALYHAPYNNGDWRTLKNGSTTD